MLLDKKNKLMFVSMSDIDILQIFLYTQLRSISILKQIKIQDTYQILKEEFRICIQHMNNERRGTRYLALDKTYFELYG